VPSRYLEINVCASTTHNGCGVSRTDLMGCLDVAEFTGALKALALLPISSEKEVTIKDIESVLDPEVSVHIRPRGKGY
jgi:hypothetical protein